ncbi:hypothetical protein WA1_13995 [Scytonema hofmannii PCC 7110]|uniref:DUF1003 domain-containing protein n=1 Tax=Scytonema hofmannii PCC 7110 TaxID=128403 RepID=A0A139XES6_9CYAN|nr:DUF1003 domain-containing protein [Scytonema hofmannii]KYC43204.1 hypothetical protein WA1_13995 [Scytonema hofmannii PCC 7110]
MKAQTNKTVKSVVELPQSQEDTSTELQKSQKTDSDLTMGQRLADAMAAKVGSWAFLTAQTSILAAWVTFNSIPGLPHWDQQPFILLNLVFSFASAYTAPIVLMSQNRQSEEDRRNSHIDHEVNRTASQNIELLHQKLDAHEQQRLELMQLLKEQQQHLSELKAKAVFAQQQQTESKVSAEATKNQNNLVYLQPVVDRGSVSVKVVRKV